MADIKVRSIKFNFIMNITLKVSALIFPLITLPYITRILGATGNGKVAFAISIVSYFSMFAQLGIPTYGIRVCAQKRENKEELTKTVHELLLLNIISATISYIMLFCCIIFIPTFQENKILILINSVSIFLNMIGIDWFYQATEQYRYITIRNLVFKSLGVIFMFLLIHNSEDYIIYGALTVLSSAGSNIFNIIHSRKYLINKKFEKYNLRQHLKPIFYFFSVSVAVSIYTNMDTVMLGFMNTDQQVGFYNIATKIKMLLITMITALGSVLLPRISYYLSQGNKKQFYYLLTKSLHFMLILVLPITTFFVLFSRDIIYILGGDKYAPAIMTMRIILFTLLPMGLGNIACIQILAPLGMEKYTMYSTIMGAILNLFINWFLIPKYGANGAALATVFAEFIVAILQIYYTRQYFKIIIKRIKFLKIIIANLINLLILIVLFNILDFMPIINICIAVLIMFIEYGVILYIFKDNIVYGYGKNILSRLFK
ncbi:flippase [Clostridium perfringens]|uniref:flippase n=3 Tax=Clostridium perfringens TaxID=1502 RepID=UPI001C888978|nr:flippase [Clostridium perfringens]MDK0849477.1 flippase [Clostridium perfringens]MDK0866972.1 flippase [Clostridium perfringens]HBI6967436.1 flippase [Clostridium perfringens]HBI6970684.1 flippase [Clostridium perfringens]HBI6973804.1 flippase [Clostridium perfringens]